MNKEQEVFSKMSISWDIWINGKYPEDVKI